MSFSNDIRLEIMEKKQGRKRHTRAFAFGLLLFSRKFDREEFSFSTENKEVAQQFERLVKLLLGRETAVSWPKSSRTGKKLYTVCLPNPDDRERLSQSLSGVEEDIADQPDAAGDFLAGAYLACGNMTDPEKGYHLEFVAREEELGLWLAEVLEEYLPGVKRTTRRGNFIAYYKDCVQIEDLLTFMGASKACLAVLDVEMLREMRNKANRVTNCETANIDKTVSAAVQQTEDIGLVLEHYSEDALPPDLLEVARLRLAHPHMSLRELAEETKGVISRSGIHRRLEKLSKMAAELRRIQERR